MEQRWPDVLWIVRHGESAGNVAHVAAYASQSLVIDIADRDIDVPLSQAGERQARALGHWFGAMPGRERPTVVLSSPYLRARRTAELIVGTHGAASGVLHCQDERLREKEFGLLDRLTKWGIEQKYPEQAELRRHLGKFYYRPPGGESWADVILRLRSVLDWVCLHHCKGRVLIVAHQVVVLCLRYLLDNLSEQEILDIDRQAEVANCSVTEYGFDRSVGRHGGMALRRYNFTVPLEAEGAPVTHEPAKTARTG
jgi:broad specificity phosphatase PhoE